MIKDLNRMAVFARVVEEGSFSSAAEALGLGKSVVSTHVSQLEKSLRCQLLVRSTRKLHLTVEGRSFYERCKQMVDVAEAARDELETGMDKLAGLVRISCSIAFGESVLCELVADFRRIYPDVQIELDLRNDYVDLIAENVDLAIRIGNFDGSNLRMTKIGDTILPLCAAREWADENHVGSPDDLAHQTWVNVIQTLPGRRLSMRHLSGKEANVVLTSVLKVNGGGAAKSLILNGAGIGPLPDYAIVGELKSGRLVTLLPEWEIEHRRTISLVFPDRIRIPARTRVLIDFIKAHAKDYLPDEGAKPKSKAAR